MNPARFPLALAVTLFVSWNAVAGAADADKGMVAFKIDAQRRSDEKNAAGFLHGFKLVEKKDVKSRDLREAIAEALNDPKSFGQIVPNCFSPGIVLRYSEGGKTYDAVVCLQCAVVHFHEGETHTVKPLSYDGKQAFLKVYKELYGEPEK